MESSTAWAAPIQELAGSRIGPYKLLQLIGEGGFGSVFMAEQQHPVTRKVALKIIKLGMDTRSVIARFEAERQALAMMDHANIACVLDAGATDSGRPYFVMELVKGDPITEYCDRNKLSLPDRLELFSQVCNAVQHAHQKGIIHRDLKPSNILVSTQDGKPFARVIDFGIAKATASRLTEKTVFTEYRQLIGTPQYMSPEQADGSLDIDTRTDVYSLGVLLYELLTGSTPFDAKALRSAAYEEMRRMIRDVEPPKPSTRLSQTLQTLPSVALNRRTEPAKLGVLVRGELDWIVMKALDKDRARRYDSPSTLAADLRRHGSGEPVLAAPPGAAYRVRKLARRYRALLATTMTIIILLASGVLISSWQAMRARRAERTVADQLGEVKAQKTAAQTAGALAEAAALKLRRQLSDSYVERGISQWDAHQPSMAALWFVQALKLDQGNPEREEVQRLRIGMSMFFSPRPLDVEVKAPPRVSDYYPGVYNDNYIREPEDHSGRIIRRFGTYIEVHDSKSGKPVTPRMEHGAKIRDCRYSPDEKLIWTVGEDNSLRFWDAASGKPTSPLLAYPGHLRNIYFSGDGSLVLTTHENTSDGNRVNFVIRVWETHTFEIVMPAVESWIKPFLSPDETMIAICDGQRRLHLRNIRTGKDTTESLQIPDFIHKEVFFSHNGKIVLVTSYGHPGFCIWQLSGPVPNWEATVDWVSKAVFTSDDKSVSVSDEGGSVRI